MDYEKAYKDALERAKDCYISKQFNELEDTPKEICEYIFPELAESEDERIRKHLIEIVKFYWGKTNAPNKAKELAYLEKLKEQKGSLRVIKDASEWEKIKEQQPAEWSEEDEKKIERLRSIVNNCAFYNDALDVNGDYCEGDYAELDDFLKSLRPQPHWKPSEEQMDTLQIAYKDMRNIKMRSTLLSLYNDLKKLM